MYIVISIWHHVILLSTAMTSVAKGESNGAMGSTVEGLFPKMGAISVKWKRDSARRQQERATQQLHAEAAGWVRGELNSCGEF